ncbi:YggS family pyridoxal phosphate-dependent enzyme [Streptococcus chenjunshii]|uniref:Pyridoxal phosphate homeostasis protein n=1 Tax=Streptococcus chenjunshii TaxID=2173853 RepID=A0A372KNC3_9STRE|nr:YggS family pyridoxal phosphate-dependent enzyme [Streptococcus chenjunshii]AXQ78212.1 YggS family pyridoxal phosphate-dependent enzyme [Streptococcus chenjunshii]RFU50917.1 YggS family pyridoxal phosphate-dependent enzyme [Streptococcus chenjunshii]RFU53414.1 YggS family pyridoxal phosphate-dependent enzyme [Streptococcus chenjunshii]
MNLQENKEFIFQQVAEAAQQANRPSDSVSVIAVTKYVDSDVTKQLIDTGVRHIGENRVDKFLDKYELLKGTGVSWHLIGSLQRRKVKNVINYVDYFHALDSIKLASEIQKRAEKTIKCFLQVNISGEESKHGFKVSEVDQALFQIAEFDKIELVGLMTMAPQAASDAEINTIFEQANKLRITLQNKKLKNMPFTELSMGMSGDFKLAVQNGSTFVRIGTAFFK